MCAYGDTYVDNVSWMKKNHMVDEILLLCHEILNKVAELRIIIQCGCPYNENRRPFNELLVFRGNWFDISHQLSRYIEPTATIYRVNCHTL